MKHRDSGLRAQAGRMRVLRKISPMRIPRADRRRRSLSPQSPDIFLRSSIAASMQGWCRWAGSADQSAFRVKYEPSNPARTPPATSKYPNVNALVEMTDMRDAQRSYEAKPQHHQRHAPDDPTHCSTSSGLNRKP